MPETVMKLLVAASVLLLVGASQEGKKSNDTEQLCAVFVSGSASDDESLIKAIKEVEKKIKDKKKLFRLTDDALDADIRIEVTQFGREDQVKSDGRRREGVQGGGTGTSNSMTRPALLDIEPGYFIEFLLVVPQQFEKKMTTSGRSRGSAAKKITQRLQTMCETYCK